MFQLISIIRSFLSELFFDHQDEAKFSSPRFNIFKWSKFMLVMASFAVNLFVIPKLFGLGLEHAKLQEETEQVKLELAHCKATLGSVFVSP